MSQTTSKSFDTQLFKRLMKYTRPYRLTFVSVAFVAILLSLLSVARPYLLKLTVDDYIITKDYQGLLTFSLIMAGILLGEVISQLYFLYYANWIGQSIVRDIRKKLFAHMLRFKMKYYDNSSVGLLVTRTVSDMERIAEIFSSGFFEIVSDLLKMLAVMIAMLLFNWKLCIDCFCCTPDYPLCDTLVSTSYESCFYRSTSTGSQPELICSRKSYWNENRPTLYKRRNGIRQF